MHRLAELKWPYGGPWDIWLKHTEQIEALIREQKLKPVAAEHLSSQAVAAERELRMTDALRPRPFPGGIISPHLHFKGEIYLLDQEQWKKFSGAMLELYRGRLAHAGTVSFEGLMEVAAAVERL